MRYLWSSLLLLLLLLHPLAASPEQRPPGRQSSIASVRKKQKFNRKPNVYNAKRNRPLIAKNPRWWRKR